MAIAFNEDSSTLSAARKEARKRFEVGRKFEANAAEAQAGIDEARQVGKFLRENLVQGVKDEKSEVYRMELLYAS
jgi:hypothetical protein